MSRRDGIIGAVPATQVPRYAGKGTFARIADIHEVSDYDIAILGVPFDGGTSYRPGARFGPMSVRQAARTLRPGYHVEFGVAPLEHVQVVDAGDVAVTPYDIAEACTQIENHAADILAGTHAFGAIAAALLRRARTGRGAHLDVSMLEALIGAEDISFGSMLNGGPSYPGPRTGMLVHQVGDGWLRLLDDYVLKAMLEQLGATVEAIEAPFQPEHGAYGGGHHHSHHGEAEFNYAPRLHQFGVRR